MNPADAARAPDGATNTTTGVRATIMRLTIVRVESSSPPGVRRTKITADASAVSARSITSTMNSLEIGWMIASTSARNTVGGASAAAACEETAARRAAMMNRREPMRSVTVSMA